MKKLLALPAILLALFAASASANSVNEQISVQFKFSAYQHQNYITYVFGGPYASETMQFSGTSGQTGSRHYSIIPGYEYNIVLTGLSTSANYDLDVAVPPGYELYLTGADDNDFKRYSEIQSRIAYGYVDTYKLKVMPVNEGVMGFAESTAMGEQGPVWLAGLGTTSVGAPAGYVGIRKDSPSQLYWTPYDLMTNAVSDEVEIIKSGSSLRQLYAPNGLVDIVTLSSTAYELRFYDWSDVGPKSGSTYTVTGSPVATYKLSKYSSEGLDVGKTAGGSNWTTRQYKSGSNLYTYDWTKGTTAPSSSNALRYSLSTTSSISGGESRTVKLFGKVGVSWVESQRTLFEYKYQGTGSDQWGPVLTKVVEGDVTATDRVTEFVYFTAKSDGAGHYRQLKELKRPGGGRTLFDYYDDFYKRGLLYQTKEDFQDSQDAKVTTYTYTSVGTGVLGNQISEELVKKHNITVGRTVYTYSTSSGVRETTIKSYSGPSSYLTSKVRTYQPDVSTGYLRDRAYEQDSPDGSKVRWVHTSSGGGVTVKAYRGFTTNVSGTGISTALLSGGSSPTYVVKEQSTLSQQVYSAQGLLTSTSESVCSSGTTFQQMAATTYTYADGARLSQIKDSANNVLYSASYLDGLLYSETDAAGAEKIYDYDDAMRVSRVTKPGKGASTMGGTSYATPEIKAVTVDIEHDGSNNVLKTTEMGAGSTEEIVSSFIYDKAGRLTSKTMDCCETVTYAYDPDNRVTTTTNPDGGTVVETLFKDGSLKSRTGTATVPFYQLTSIVLDRFATQTSREAIPAVGTPNDGYSLSWYDWLGREEWRQVLGFQGSVTAILVNEFDSKGRISKRRTLHNYPDYGGADVLAPYVYQYNAINQVVLEGTDISHNGLVKGSTDRLVGRDGKFSFLGGAWWWVNNAYAYPTDAVATSVHVSEQRVRVTPIAGELGSSVSVDQNDNITTAWTQVDRSKGIVAERSVFNPYGTGTDFNESAAVSKLGLPVYSISQTGARMQSDYDHLRRLRTRHTRDLVGYKWEYKQGSRKVQKVFDKHRDYDTGALVKLRVENTYDSAGRIAKSTRLNNVSGSSANEETNYVYDTLGNVRYTWGNGTYPVQSFYNAYGQLTEQRQYRSDVTSQAGFASAAVSSKVTWEYDGITGALKRKVHWNGTTQNDVQYQYNVLGQITQLTRADNDFLVYAYSYGDSAKTGELTWVEDSADSGNDLAYYYDRMGRFTMVIDSTGQRTFSYAAQSGMALSQENLPAFYGSNRNFAFTYESTGTAKVPGRQSSFTFNGVTWQQAYNASTGRLASSVAAAPSYSEAFAYGFDDDSDRLLTVDGASYRQQRIWENWREVLRRSQSGWSSAYENRSHYEIAGGGLSWQHQKTAVTLHDAGSVSLSDKLRGSSGSVTYQMAYDPRGQLTSWDTSTAGSDATYAWDHAGNPTNFDGTAFSAVTQSNELEPSQSGDQYTYDADGNLTADGVWTYQYDTFNRLYRMWKTGKSLQFKYDYMGRRVEKKAWNATNTFSGTPVTHLKYAYQGMELVAETDSAGTLRKSFHWGVDKSDTRGGAGGAMGLVMWRDYVGNDKSYYPSYDLNGNVTGLLDDSGNYAAWYEYDAFGKVVTEGGSMKDANPVRFSTRYTDEETGLVYYGFRFYDPAKGRFLNRDPIGESGGLNLYQMVGNDPVNRVDVWGLSADKRWRDDDDRISDDPWYERANYGGNSPSHKHYLLQAWRRDNTNEKEVYGDTEGAGGGSDSEGTTDDGDQKEKEEEKPKLPPCSQIRRQVVGEFLPNSNSLEGVGKGIGSWFRGLGRSVDANFSGYHVLALINQERGAEIREADGLFVQGIWNLTTSSETYSDFQEKATLAADYFTNNLGSFGGRAGTGVAVGKLLQKTLGRSWLGPALSASAFRGDSNYLIRQGIDPTYAFIFSELGLAGEEQMRSLASDLFDDKKLQEFTGIPCEEGK